MTAGCPPLHIPYKDWSGQQKELENYLAIERWTEIQCGGGGCDCFFEHKSFSQDVVINDLTEVSPLTTEITVGSRAGWDDARSTMLVVNWQLDNPDDFSDGTRAIVKYGYGCLVEQSAVAIGGSHGFIVLEPAVDFYGAGWASNISGIADGPLMAGSYTTFLNQKEPGLFPNRWDFTVYVYVGLDNPGASVPTISGDTYEYGLCGCNAQE